MKIAVKCIRCHKTTTHTILNAVFVKTNCICDFCDVLLEITVVE